MRPGKLSRRCQSRILKWSCCLAVALWLISSPLSAADSSYRGNLTLQQQHFTANDQFNLDAAQNSSMSGFVELTRELGSPSHTLTIAPFFRIDQQDENRSHVDFREFIYRYFGDEWELQAGLGQVFWGVVESRNIVNVLNQTDQLEGPTSTEKLGQPMLSLSRLLPEGSLELFLLPASREREFPGEATRPRLSDNRISSTATFESGAEDQHLDFALRWDHSLSDWDIGFSYFQGTARNPSFRNNPESDLLTPFYPQISQIGFDAQGIYDDWLLKLEMVRINGKLIQRHHKLVAGAEYSFYSIADTDFDINVLAEYAYDGLGEADIEMFQNELIAGLRLLWNDPQSTELLLVAAVDLDDNSQFYNAEFSRRLGNSFRLNIEAATYPDEFYLGVEIGYFF